METTKLHLPFGVQPLFDHLKTELVKYSNLHCVYVTSNAYHDHVAEPFYTAHCGFTRETKAKFEISNFINYLG